MVGLGKYGECDVVMICLIRMIIVNVFSAVIGIRESFGNCKILYSESLV